MPYVQKARRLNHVNLRHKRCKKKKYLSLTPRDKKYLSQKKNTLEEVKDIR